MSRATPTGSKWCPGCTSALPLSAFGLNKARADGRQSRCSSCRNKAKAAANAVRAAGRAEQREREEAGERVANWPSDLQAIAGAVQGLGIAETRMTSLNGPAGFGAVPLHVLLVPRTHGRWPKKYGSDECAITNWCALIDWDAQARYQRRRADWILDPLTAASSAENDSP